VRFGETAVSNQEENAEREKDNTGDDDKIPSIFVTDFHSSHNAAAESVCGCGRIALDEEKYANFQQNTSPMCSKCHCHVEQFKMASDCAACSDNEHDKMTPKCPECGCLVNSHTNNFQGNDNLADSDTEDITNPSLSFSRANGGTTASKCSCDKEDLENTSKNKQKPKRSIKTNPQSSEPTLSECEPTFSESKLANQIETGGDVQSSPKLASKSPNSSANQLQVPSPKSRRSNSTQGSNSTDDRRGSGCTCTDKELSEEKDAVFYEDGHNMRYFYFIF
jgi:hypothetical protein